MKAPSLKETTVLSLILHALVFFTAVFMVNRASHITLPSPYTVRLVAPSERTSFTNDTGQQRASAERIRAIKRKRQERMLKKKIITAKKSPPAKTIQKSVPAERIEKSPPAERITVDEKIAALRAKKRIERIVELRRAVLSVTRDQEAAQHETPATERIVRPGGGATPDGSLLISYYRVVQERVWSEWVYPAFRSTEGIEAVVNVTILRDGQIKVQDVVKSSGNALFDRSAVRAIAKASPLPPPPHELQIGLRFSP